MAPRRKKEIEVIDSLEPISVKTDIKSSKITERISVREKQKRITTYHWVVHILAFVIIIPYVVLIIFKYTIPDSYATIVSVVIGFYFAKSLFN